VLENHIGQRDMICQVLASAGHTCLPYQSGNEILSQLRRENVDLLILNWQLPDLSGMQVLHWIREKLPDNFPVLLVTGRSGEDDIVAAWAAGANDYMITPIRRGELVVRVQALLRCAYPNRSPVEQIQFGRYIFEAHSGRLSRDGDPIEVTQKEFSLALLFFRNLGRPLSRAFILESVWTRDVDIPSRTMDTHVSRVRSKLQLRPENGFRLAPVYSYGYRLEQIGG
jgi:DNA-binding response OmpR family regulator